MLSANARRCATRGSYAARWAGHRPRARCQACAWAPENPPRACTAPKSLISCRSISSICAPAARRCCKLRSKARATVASKLSSITVRATASLMPRTSMFLAGTRLPDNTSCAVMASRTDRVSAPTESSVLDSGTVPAVGTVRAVGLNPTTPHKAAGMRSEPPVSDPSPINAAPVATDTAAPLDEPPGMRATCVSQGFTGVP